MLCKVLKLAYLFKMRIDLITINLHVIVYQDIAKSCQAHEFLDKRWGKYSMLAQDFEDLFISRGCFKTH